MISLDCFWHADTQVMFQEALRLPLWVLLSSQLVLSSGMPSPAGVRMSTTGQTLHLSSLAKPGIILAGDLGKALNGLV